MTDRDSKRERQRDRNGGQVGKRETQRVCQWSHQIDLSKGRGDDRIVTTKIM